MPAPTPRIFIGSSTESLPAATAIRDILVEKRNPDVVIDLWSSAFRLGDTNIEALERMLDRADFALLVLTGSDRIIDHAGDRTPRDNVIFELGLFMGRIGRDRCFLADDKRLGWKLTDLSGVVRASYEPGPDGDLRQALEAPCAKIHDCVRERGERQHKEQPSALASWESSRIFSRRIAGCWWSHRNWDRNTLGFVQISIDPALALPQVVGDAFRRDGSPAAHWESIACCVLPKDRKLYYYFNGHEIRPKGRVEGYDGFCEYTFDENAVSLESGTGVFSDRNLANAWELNRRSTRLQRCADGQPEIMRTRHPGLVAPLLAALLPRPKRR